MASGPFDPLHVWLGIAPEEQPPNHYRLLGIPLFERDLQVISVAAQRQIAHVKIFAIAEYSDFSQKLLGQLSRAKICLLNPAKRAKYDEQLKKELAAARRSTPDSSIQDPTFADTDFSKSGPGRAQTSSRQPPVSKADTDGLLSSKPLRTPQKSTRSWVVGSAADCDVLVDSPTVSGHHCRLTRTRQGFLLEDLGSANGTYVNGRKITTPATLLATDIIRLGQRVRFVWPSELTVAAPPTIRVGAALDNDVVLDLPMISGHHALIRLQDDTITIEDLGSTNGTALRRRWNKIRKAGCRPRDTVYFGSYATQVSQLLAHAAIGLKSHGHNPSDDRSGRSRR